MSDEIRECPRDCAASGGDTISRHRGLIDDEQKECVVCHHSVLWNLTESPFCGFMANCNYRGDILAERAKGSQ